MADTFTPYDVEPVLWSALAPVAAEVDRAERRVTRRVAAVLAVVTLLVAVVMLCGVGAPRIGFQGGGSGEWDDTSHTAVVELDVRNWSLVPVAVDGPASVAIPGIEVMQATTDGPISAWGVGRMRVSLRATDCGRALASEDTPSSAALTVTAHTWRGDQPVVFDRAETMVFSDLPAEMCGRG